MTAPDRQALTLILEALSLPYAATTGEDQKRARLMADRVMDVRVFLDAYLSDSSDHMDGLPVELFRERVAEMPPADYVTGEQAYNRLAAGATWSEAVTPQAETNGEPR